MQERYLKVHQSRRREPTPYEDLLGDSIERGYGCGSSSTLLSQPEKTRMEAASQAAGDLLGIVNGFANRQCSIAQSLAQCLTFEQFADNVGTLLRGCFRIFDGGGNIRSDVVNGKDVRMVHIARGARLPIKPFAQLIV